MAGKGIEEELKRLRDEFDALDHATSVHGGPPLDPPSIARSQARKGELLRQIHELEKQLETSKKGCS
jgi:hypothetical protein